jgi:hypothetical protein
MFSHSAPSRSREFRPLQVSPKQLFSSESGRHLQDKVAFAPIDPYIFRALLAALKRHSNFFRFLDLPNFRFTQ